MRYCINKQREKGQEIVSFRQDNPFRVNFSFLYPPKISETSGFLTFSMSREIEYLCDMEIISALYSLCKCIYEK